MSVVPIPQSDTPRDKVSPLQNGDRLSRAEFERRYAATPNLNKAELIEGIVYIPSPVRFRAHSKPHITLVTWLGYYVAKTPGLSDFGDNGTVRLDNDNEPQPDLFLLLPSKLGGRATIDEDDYVSGPPTLACEIASSSTNIDLHHKKNVYRRNGVEEYLVWRVDDAAVDFFILTNGEYAAQSADATGLLKSAQFPGLWLDVPALLRGDLLALFAAIDRGVSTKEHLDFLSRLKA